MNSGGWMIYGGEKICVGEKTCDGEKPCDSVTLTMKEQQRRQRKKPWNSSLQDGERSFL